jgi:hypothetical protein
MTGTKTEPIIPAAKGMCASIPGVLLRAAEACESHRDSKYLGWGLRELDKHLHDLHSDPTIETLHSFLSLWRP